MKNYFAYNTPFGKITLSSDGTSITRMAFGDVMLEGNRIPNSVMNAAATQLQEYFAGHRRLFDIPIALNGTPFQLEVWHSVELIPYGETRTYSEVAANIGKPGSARAVGRALNANPIPIIVPCHRVLPAAGGIGGYAYGEAAKRFLLELESDKGR